ncbi:MAG: hypothetical protein Q8Q56_02530 [Alphaproteobacteria bacterium]|nr:hypothetical protein [Alphaproteobacteria bacterium]
MFQSIRWVLFFRGYFYSLFFILICTIFTLSNIAAQGADIPESNSNLSANRICAISLISHTGSGEVEGFCGRAWHGKTLDVAKDSAKEKVKNMVNAAAAIGYTII